MRAPVSSAMHRFILAWAICFLTAAASLAQDIKYEKYTLPNGMTVILHEDHSLPVATINTWYRVGAKDEQPGRSGFAHLFEHLMFMGTERVPGSDFDNLMEAGGGSNNASTSFDRTNYFSSGPASLLPTLLWLDADRLEDLARTMDVAKLDRQRDVVRNELRQQVENRPYGKAGEYIYRLMYPPGHPYHNAVYGTHEDLEAANVWNVKDFFATYYVPNNASLVVAGDFDPAVVKPLVQSLFGTLPQGAPPPRRDAVSQPKLPGVVRETMIDKCQLPKIMMTWHSPPIYAEGDAELSLAAAVLSQGKASRLYKRLVFDDKTAVSVSAAQDNNKLGSMFTVEVLTKPDADLNAVARAIDEELARFCADGPTAEELSQRQATVELAMLARLQSVDARADKLNEYEYYWGEPNSFKRDLDRFRNATAAGVRDWARRVIGPDARVVLRILPEEPERPASARDARPADLAPGPFAPLAPQTFALSNGVKVMHWQRSDLPLVSVQMLLKPGRTLDTPPLAGAADLCTTMMGEGAGDLDSLAFSSTMQSLGAAFGCSADKETAGVSLTVLKRNLDRAVGLMADAVARPRMADSDWSRVKALHLDNLRQQEDEPAIVAAKVGMRALYGDANPYAWPVDGTLRTIEPMALDAVKSAHAAIFRPEHATILIAGDLSTAEATSLLEKHFGAWKAGDSRRVSPEPAPDLAIPAAGGMRVIVVNRPEAVQTVIRFVMPGVKLADDRRVPLQLINTLLGGSFTSRLNQNLREQHGYTYGARSRFSMEPGTGSFAATSSVRADVTGESLKEFLKELRRLSPPTTPAGQTPVADIPDAEASKAAKTLRQDIISSFAGLNGLLAQAAELTAAGLPIQTIGEDLKRIDALTAADLNALAPAMLNLDRAILVLVGDKALILKQLEGLALPKPVEMDAGGVAMGE